MARAPRWIAALLLAGEAVAVVTPVSAASGYVAGAQTIGKALRFVPVPDVVGQGFAQALTPLLTVLLLLAAWGVGHAARGVGALLLQPGVLAFAWIPFLAPLAALDPAGPWPLTVLVAATVVCLVVVLAGGRDAGAPHGHRRWWWLTAYALGIVVFAAVGGLSRSLPSGPADLLADPGGGTPPAAGPPGAGTPQNPGLAANPYNSIHNDSWATDSSPRPAGPAQPGSAAVDSLFTGGDCATITFDSRGRLVTLCSTLTAVLAYVVDPSDLSVLHQETVGSRTPDLTDFSGGGYFVLDDRDRIVFPAAGGVIRVLTTEPAIAPAAAIPVTDALLPDEKITSVLPDWRGRYWFVGNRGSVGVVGERGGPARSLNLGQESIENSFAVTRNAVYVVTGAALYRLWARPNREPVVRWRTPYDVGERPKPGQTSRASGTTPTVFAGGRLVAITDNGDPDMHLVVARTRDGRVTCDIPAFGGGTAANENSLIAAGNRLVVENNYGYRPPITATAGGHSTTPGLAAFTVAPRTGSCRPHWRNDTVTIPSLVSKASLVGNQVLTYTKPADPRGVDAWYFTGVDLTSGQVAWRRLAGTGIAFNNHYAAAALSPSGDLLVGTVNGIVRLRNGAG